MGTVPSLIGEVSGPIQRGFDTSRLMTMGIQIHQQIDELLQPVHFDWAEEVEEEMSTTEFDYQEASAVGPYGCGVDDCPGGSHAGTDECDNVPLDLSSTSRSPSPNAERSSFLGDETTQTQIEVSREFAWRAYCMHRDEAIHHFNWLGSPVYHYNATPPAVSLFYILADPKVPQPGAELRLQSVLHMATAFIDPVVVYLENGLSDLQVKGHELIRFATGRAFKFYTPHGQWTSDWLEKGDQTTIDDGDFYTYISPNLASGNGFVEVCPIRSRAKWAEVRNGRLASARAFSSNLYRAKKKGGVYKPSLLRNEVSYNDVISDGTTSNKTDEIQDTDANSEEALDKVFDLPACTPSHKRLLQASSFSPFKEPIERRHSSVDLRTEIGFARNAAQVCRDDLSAAKDSSWLYEGISAGIRPSLDETPICENDNESNGSISSTNSRPKTRHGLVKPETNTKLPHSSCYISSDEDESDSYHADGILQSDTDLETTSGRINTPPTEPLKPSIENAPHFSQLNFDSPIEFLPAWASDVYFVSIGSRSRGSWATLHDWKTKLKQMHASHWHEVSTKSRSVLKLERKNQSSSLSRSSSFTYTPKSTPISIPEHHEMSKFTQEYLSFPTPKFDSTANDADLKNAKYGHGDATSSSFGSKVFWKARSLSNKIKNGLRSSSDNRATKRKRRLISKVAKSCVVRFSSMGPYPYYPASGCF